MEKLIAVALLTSPLFLACTSAAGYDSRTDLLAAPETVPALCPSAPCSMTSSDLNPGLTYTRVTDGNTRPDRPGREWATQGSAEQMEWNADSSAFAVAGSGGELVP